MDFYANEQHVVITNESRGDASPSAVYTVTVDEMLAGRITRVQAGEWRYIRVDGTQGYARSSTMAAEALVA